MKNRIIILALLFSVTAALSAQTKKQAGKSKSITADTTLANEYFKQGIDLKNKSKYDSAIISYKKAKEIFFKIQNWDKFVKTLNFLGDIYRLKRDYDSSFLYLMLAETDGKKFLGDNHLELARTYTYYGMANWNQGKYNEALNNYFNAVNIRIKILGENDENVAWNYNNIGVVYINMGYYEKALEYQKKSLEIRLKTIGEYTTEVSDNYNALGVVYDEMGYYEKALYYKNKSLEIRLKVHGENHAKVAAAFSNIGIVYSKMGDYDKAIEIYEKSLRIYLKILGANNPSVANTYDNIGRNYSEFGNEDNSLENHLIALNIRLKTLGEDHPETSNSYNNIGITYYNKQNYVKALEYFDKALSIRMITMGENHYDVAGTLINKALVYRDMKDFKKSISFYQRALSIYQIYYPNNPNLLEAYQGLAKIYLVQEQYFDAITFFQKAIISSCLDSMISDNYANPKINNFINEHKIVEMLNLKAFSFFEYYIHQTHSLNDLQASLSTYELASDLIDKIRRGYKAEGSKLFLGKKAAEIYENAIRAALTMYDVTKDKQYKDKAFFFAEKNRANVLLDAMADSRAKSFGDIPDSLLEQEKNLKIDLSFYDTQIQREQEKAKDADSTKTAEYQDKYFDLNRRYQSLIDTLEKRYPRYYELKYQTSVASVSDIQKNLDDNTALIEYFTGDSNLYIFTITKNDFQIHSAAKDTSFNSLVKRFYASIRKSDRADYAATNYEMYKTLILPAAKHIRKQEKWVIIPDGPLYYVPFEAMTVKPSKSDDYASLPYLVRERDVRYHYSATLWNRDSGSKPVHQYEFAGFAPVFSDTVKNGRMIGQNFSVLDTMNPGVAYRSVDRGSNALRALPKSEDELTAIVRAFESRRKNAVGYLHREASEDNFKARAASSRILHVATHGLINEKKPKLSALAFSQPEDSLAKEDGLLYSGEIYNLKTSADLVVLSSCESGLGEIVRGEGMMALNRGFIYAGADHIVTSLWRVLDDNARSLMTAMYAEMLSGRSYSESLRRAKLAMIKNPQTSAPSQWSAFVLFGK